MMQDVYQIEAFRIPLHVELTELMEMKVTLKMDCGGRPGERKCKVRKGALTQA